jgi:hypothetical protein
MFALPALVLGSLLGATPVFGLALEPPTLVL